MSKNYKSGKPAEDFFKHCIAPVDYPQQPIEDLRGNHIEGDFSIGRVHKNIIEVKGDHVCFRNKRPTGRLPIEIKNTANRDGEGWFTHCQADSVEEIVFICYDGENKAEPVCSIRIPFMLLEAYVTAKLEDTSYRARAYRRATDKDGNSSYNLCVSLKELYAHCRATVVTARAKCPELREIAQAALEKMGISGTVGQYAHISFSEDDKIGGLPR